MVMRLDIKGLKTFFFLISIRFFFFKESVDMCYFYKKITGLFKLVGEGKEKGHMSMINFCRERVRRC